MNERTATLNWAKMSIIPMLILPPFRPFIAMLNPWPSSPSKLLTGTLQSSRMTCLVGWEFQPIWNTKYQQIHLWDFRPDTGGLLFPRYRRFVVFPLTNPNDFCLYLFFFFAKMQTRSAVFHQHTGNAFWTCRSCAAHDKIHVCRTASTDKLLKHGKQEQEILVMRWC